MDSTIEPGEDQPTFEPMLEVVEGDAKGQDPQYAIVPDAFEQVMAKYEGVNYNDEIVAPEPFYKNRLFIGALCVFTGLLIGRFGGEPRVITKVVEAKPQISAATPTAKPTEPVVTAANPVLKQPFRELKDSKEFDPWKPLNGGFPVPPKESQERLAGNITPMNPGQFDSIPRPSISGDFKRGGQVLPMDPGALPGGLPDQNGETKNDTNAETPSNQNGVKAVVASEKYVSMSMNGPEPESGQSRLLGIASNFGGTGRSFVHMTEEGSVESHGVLLIVPMSKYEDAKSAIEKLGGASVESELSGTASRYQGTIQGMFVTRLAKLREKRKDLLVDFLEDAQPVKQITEAIDTESRAVSATRLGGNLSGKVVFRVMLK